MLEFYLTKKKYETKTKKIVLTYTLVNLLVNLLGFM